MSGNDDLKIVLQARFHIHTRTRVLTVMRRNLFF